MIARIVLKKKALFLSIFIIIILLFSACSSKNINTTPATPQSATTGYYGKEGAIAEESIAEYDMAVKDEIAGAGDSGGLSDDNITEVEQKIIKSANIDMTIKNYDEIVSEMRQIVEKADGYVESANTYISTYNSKEYKNGSLIVRVPSDSYETIKKAFIALGKVTNDSESAVNETQEYYDIQARLETKQAEEKRLLEMIEKAQKIEDLILLEERLANVRGDIETYQSRMINIDRLSSYSTISLHLSEQPDEVIEPVADDLMSQMKNAFIGSMNGIKRFFEVLIVFIAGAIVPILMIAAVVSVVLIMRKKSMKESKKDKE